MIADQQAGESPVVGQGVDPAGDQAVSQPEERVVDRRVSPAESPIVDQAVSQVDQPVVGQAVSLTANPVVVPVVVPAIGTSVVWRSARPVVGQMDNRAVSQVDNAVIDLVLGVHPMSARSARPGRWDLSSPTRSTSPNSIQQS